MFETLLFSVNDAIATIAFNRPNAMNCFDKKMADELEILTDRVKADKTIRVVLLKGMGNLFMAGGDIHFFYKNLDVAPEGIMKIVRTLNASILNLMRAPKPVVVSVHGVVAGVGISFMLAGDLIISAATTKFTTAYSGIGLSPDGGASYNLPRLVGTKKAMEWLLLPDVFDASTAHLYGLINWVVPDDQLEEKTQALLKRLAKGPTHAYAAIKRLINQSSDCTLETQLEAEGEAFESCTVTQDFSIGLNAFIKKNKPEFKGE